MLRKGGLQRKDLSVGLFHGHQTGYGVGIEIRSTYWKNNIFNFFLFKRVMIVYVASAGIYSG